jgi:DNA-binding beta-propeller fold protein YncE
MTTVGLSGPRLGVPLTRPFGVAVAADGSWGFASLGGDGDLGVFRLSAGHAPVLVHTIALPAAPTAGIALSADGRLLLIATESTGAFVVSVPAAESGANDAVLGTLSVPGARLGGAIEVAMSPDDRYAFVSLESADEIAVFNLRAALAHGFGPAAFVGAIPTQVAPVGLAFAPDGRWLYSTSEARNFRSNIGTLEVINVARAESDPAESVVARVPAGCNPVRVTTSANGTVVWVTARASNALLAFSATALRAHPRSALLADVAVGEAPVGLAQIRNGSLIVVADSNRFNASGQHGSLAVVDVHAALAGQPALLGYLPAGVFPRDVAANPAGTAVLVANFASDQVESVDVADLP